MIALLPALLTEFGMVAYFTTRTLATAEDALNARAFNSARHLADALSPVLQNGDLARTRQLLDDEMNKSQLSFVRLLDGSDRVVALSHDPVSNGAPDASGHLTHRTEIRVPASTVADAQRSPATQRPAFTLLGSVEVGVSLRQLSHFKRDTLIHAALLMCVALILTGGLAWRLSSRLSGQLRHVGQVVGRLACDDLGVRAHLAPTGEVGALAAGINNMAEALQMHRLELEKRVREATADLAAKKDMAERANFAKSRFFAAASHDLRQPLHALSLFVAALKLRNPSPETQSLIENIEASTSAMESLFNALLDISRLDAGTIEVHPVHFSLKKLLGELDKQFSALAAEKHLRLHFRPCDVALYSDPLLVERILANLIANAIRYTDDGGILVACRRRGRMVRLSVYDTGRGIPPDQLDSVFQEFVQLHNPARDRSKGLGLGLAIVSRLGRLLGHRINVHSRPQHGSVFSLEVPRGDMMQIQSPIPVSAPGAIPADALVVLIDDESAILRGMAELFDNWHIDLITAHSAEEALQWLDTIGRVPDVIVSDYRLPDDVDGIEVIARIREQYGREIPAILVTGDTAPDTILRISRAGFPLLHKPLRPAKLRALLTYLIQQARAPAMG